MREVKFRMLCTTGDKPWHHWIFPDAVEYCQTSMKHYNLATWSQYTGLKDKNGREIYEGDLVTNHGVTNDLKRREFEVVWNEVNARFSLHDIRANLRTSIDLDSASECEIIGNIYEEPLK